ncbi:Uncharacterised protein [Chlamydia abortus]|nr:Uncharacterised protein [Chlamydia abortus]
MGTMTANVLKGIVGGAYSEYRGLDAHVMSFSYFIAIVIEVSITFSSPLELKLALTPIS